MGNAPREQLDPVRLVDAADAVLAAVQEVEQATGATCPYPPELLGSPNQPACLRDYSRFEIEQATTLLIRMGFIVVPSPAKGRRDENT